MTPLHTLCIIEHLAINRHRAVLGAQQAHQHIGQAAFSCTRLADDGGGGIGDNRQINRLERGALAARVMEIYAV